MCVSEVAFVDDVFLDAVGHRRRSSAPLIRRHGHTHSLIDLLDDRLVQIRRHDDLLPLHTLEVVERLLHVALLHVVLDELGKHVAQADRLLDALLLDESLAYLSHSLGVAGCEGLSGGDELLNVVYSFDECVLLEVLIGGVGLVELGLCLTHGSEGLFVVSVLVDLDLGTGVVEVGEVLVRLGLLVEGNDGRHYLGAVVPVL